MYFTFTLRILFLSASLCLCVQISLACWQEGHQRPKISNVKLQWRVNGCTLCCPANKKLKHNVCIDHTRLSKWTVQTRNVFLMSDAFSPTWMCWEHEVKSKQNPEKLAKVFLNVDTEQRVCQKIAKSYSTSTVLQIQILLFFSACSQVLQTWQIWKMWHR